MRRKSSMSRVARLGLVVVAGLVATTTTTTPVLALGTTGPIFDGTGVDYDAACVVRNPIPAPPPNSIASPGGAGCPGWSMYDGSTESTDINNVSLSTNGVDNAGPSDTQLEAVCYLDAAIPRAGLVAPPPAGPDLPAGFFNGMSCKVMFQNPERQNTTPTNSVGGGAPRGVPPLGAIFDLHGHWLDGYHHFIGFNVEWDGFRWIHSARVGTYDPLPNGGFFFTELGIDDGSGNGWTSHDPHMIFGINWNVVIAGNRVAVTVDGVVRTSCILCIGPFHTVYAKRGDPIVNVKGLTTADIQVTLPATLPLSLSPGFSDVRSIGGFDFFSDTTKGNSMNAGLVGGLLARNIVGIAYTPGLPDRPLAGEWLGLFGNGPIPDEVSRWLEVTWLLGASMPDTVAPSPACWTPTFGGTFPVNPWFNPNIGCHYDDDNIPVPVFGSPLGQWTAIHPGERGTFLPEFWDTGLAFTA